MALLLVCGLHRQNQQKPGMRRKDRDSKCDSDTAHTKSREPYLELRGTYLSRYLTSYLATGITHLLAFYTVVFNLETVRPQQMFAKQKPPSAKNLYMQYTSKVLGSIQLPSPRRMLYGIEKLPTYARTTDVMITRSGIYSEF